MYKICNLICMVLLLSGGVAAAQPDVPVSEYWLGIGFTPLPPPLRAHLNLPEQTGLLVEAVVPESPAAKAGIQQHDVLLRAADKPLAEPRDLIEAVEAAKDTPLKLELIRSAKPLTIEVTPAKRPPPDKAPGEMPRPEDWQAMQNWWNQFDRWMGREDDSQRPRWQFRFMHPGAIIPGDVFKPAPLPSGMSIVVSKEGDQPARIVVKRGDEKWEVTEKELDQLPADVRPHVERMLGRGLLGVIGSVPGVDFDVKAPLPERHDPQPPRGPGMADRLERRMDEMNRRIERLMKAVEELRSGSAQEKP